MVREFKAELGEKDAEVDKLTTDVVNLKKKIMLLENKLEDTESYERSDTVVLSGSDIPPATDNEDTSQVVSTLMKDKVGYFLRPAEISVAHRLGPKAKSQAPDKRNIIVKLCRREVKHDMIKVCRTAKPSNIYINESLTKTRSTVLYGLRQAKKKYPGLVSGCSSSEGRVFAWVKPPNPTTPGAKNTKTLINTKERFIDFCTNTLKCNSSDLVSVWPSY